MLQASAYRARINETTYPLYHKPQGTRGPTKISNRYKRDSLSKSLFTNVQTSFKVINSSKKGVKTSA